MAGGLDPPPIIDVAPFGVVDVEPVVAVDEGNFEELPVELALDEAVGSAGGRAAALVGSCGGGLLDPAHAAEQMAQVTAMMVVFMSVPLVWAGAGCKLCAQQGPREDRRNRRAVAHPAHECPCALQSDFGYSTAGARPGSRSRLTCDGEPDQ